MNMKIPSRQTQDPPSVFSQHGGHLFDHITFFGIFNQPRYLFGSSLSDSQILILASRAFPLAELRTLQTFPQVKQREGREKRKVECHISPQLEVHESSQSLLELLSTLVVLDLVLEGVDKE